MKLTFFPPPRVKAFTLIELLMYISIASILMIIVASAISTVYRIQVKQRFITDVEQEGLAAMQTITQTIRNANAINSPTIGTSATTLSVAVSDLSKTPTIFTVTSGKLTIKEGAAAAVDLTSGQVSITGVSFTNMTRGTTQGNVRVQYTVNSTNPNNLNEFDAIRSFDNAASLRF
jgi:type II secretory pathway pseudopilin PulG